MNKLDIGIQAPNFALPNSKGEVVEMTKLNGKNIILYFYPKDDTPGCTIEANGFNSFKEEFEKLNTVILGVSKDNTVSHNKFICKYDLKFELLTDELGKTCEDYGVWVQKSMFGKKYMGIDRVTFLIDEEGNIKNIWPKVSVLSHAQEVLEFIKKN